MTTAAPANPPIRTVADAIAERLAQYGVDTVFGIPGTHNIELFRALDAAGIAIVSAHHEQGLGYAADGYSRVTGRPAVVVTTTGPGLTNAITAIATSLAASVPLLVIAPGIPGAAASTTAGWLHDLPSQIGLMEQLVRSVRAESGIEAVHFIDEAARSWEAERPAPAYLEVPFDRFAAPAVDARPPLPLVTGGPMLPAEDDIARAADFLAEAVSPLIIAGRGATNPDAAQALRVIAERLHAPVMTTANAKGVIDECHELSLGVSLRVAAGHELIERADALLVVGTDLGSSEFWGTFPGDGERMVRVEVDPRGITANATPRFALVGRSERVMPRLAALIGAQARAASAGNWVESARETITQALARDGQVYRKFHEHLQHLTAGRDIAVTGDSSQATYFGTATYWKAPRPNRFLYPAGFGTLGYAVPAAIGAALSGQVERVVAITGEGGALFSIQELATVAEYGLPIVMVVFVNGGYQEITEGMERAGIPPRGTTFPAPDFVALARGMHLKAWSMRMDGAEESEFRDTLAVALDGGEPALIAVDIGT